MFYAAPGMFENGWEFGEMSGSGGIRFLHDLYVKAEPGYTGRVTVPVLWDEKDTRIVNNESAEIIRMLNREGKSIGSTNASTARSTTAFTARDSPPLSTSTRRP